MRSEDARRERVLRRNEGEAAVVGEVVEARGAGGHAVIAAGHEVDERLRRKRHRVEQFHARGRFAHDHVARACRRLQPAAGEHAGLAGILRPVALAVHVGDEHHVVLPGHRLGALDLAALRVTRFTQMPANALDHEFGQGLAHVGFAA